MRSYCYKWSISVRPCGLRVIKLELPVDDFEIVGPAPDTSARLQRHSRRLNAVLIVQYSDSGAGCASEQATELVAVDISFQHPCALTKGARENGLFLGRR